jgi:hypothetical protein
MRAKTRHCTERLLLIDRFLCSIWGVEVAFVKNGCRESVALHRDRGTTARCFFSVGHHCWAGMRSEAVQGSTV